MITAVASTETVAANGNHIFACRRIAADNATAKSENAAVVQKHGARHAKSYAQRKSDRQALKSTAKAVTPDAAADDADNSSAIPPAVASANAQLAPTGTPAGNARAMSARANDIMQTPEAQPAADSQPPTVTRGPLEGVQRSPVQVVAEEHDRGPLDDPECTASDIRYLLDAVNSVLSGGLGVGGLKVLRRRGKNGRDPDAMITLHLE